MFNRVLDERLSERATEVLRLGDLAWVHRSRAVFLVDDEEFKNPELARRAAALELSPSGPMWGPGMTLAAGVVLKRERQLLCDFGLSEADLKNSSCELEGARRPMRCRIENSMVDAGSDEHGPYVRVAFDLERGSFATMVLREIVNDQPGAPHAEGDVESS
jgi:tRNA pseudouridine13 synthase